MLATHSALLKTYSIVLASASPRRRELLAQVLPKDVAFRVEVSGFAEDLAFAGDASAYVSETARRKGDAVAARLAQEEEEDLNSRPLLVIAADTVVVVAGGSSSSSGEERILEKPPTAPAAHEMLAALSGTEHDVRTGVALSLRRGDRTTQRVFVESTRVAFSPLSDATIGAYVSSGEPFDKAGGYGIQGAAGAFVERIDGCFYNVVGLPMNRLARELAAMLGDVEEGEKL